jgi:hypothetical protein
MTVTVLDRALVAGDAGRMTGERQERPDPEVPEKARRRTFTAQYKLDVVAEYDAARTRRSWCCVTRTHYCAVRPAARGFSCPDPAMLPTQALAATGVGREPDRDAGRRACLHAQHPGRCDVSHQ